MIPCCVPVNFPEDRLTNFCVASFVAILNLSPTSLAYDFWFCQTAFCCPDVFRVWTTTAAAGIAFAGDGVEDAANALAT